MVFYASVAHVPYARCATVLKNHYFRLVSLCFLSIPSIYRCLKVFSKTNRAAGRFCGGLGLGVGRLLLLRWLWGCIGLGFCGFGVVRRGLALHFVVIFRQFRRCIWARGCRGHHCCCVLLGILRLGRSRRRWCRFRYSVGRRGMCGYRAWIGGG